MARILVVDDEPDILHLVRRFAEHDGYEITGAANGREAVELCKAQDFDLIIMDVMMPGMDGFTACEAIRKEKDIPVLMLSARDAEYDRLRGFDAGVDDYVTKPFSPKELMARVRVIIQRHNLQKGSELTWKELRVNVLKRSVTLFGNPVELTAKEFDLLVFFLENKGMALSRDQILNAVWGYEYFGEDRTVDWQIKLLRNKLGSYRGVIKTLRGVGYKFDENEQNI